MFDVFREIEAAYEKIVGMSLSTFQLLLILHWEVSQFVVANKKLLLSFAISRDSHSYVSFLREELFVHSYFTSRVVVIRISRESRFCSH